MDLTPRLRAVVVMKYFDGLSYDEIARVLGVSAGTVASRLNRALLKMEERLRPLRGLL
jgi:RNA polymerase sigma-70 factor (ECF subfamily)